MKYKLFLVLTFMSMTVMGFSSCANVKDPVHSENNKPLENSKISIQIGSKAFTATLLDNNTATAFLEMLPMTVKMVELNGDEKYHDLSKSLPINAANPGTTRAGDLMVFGSKTLVLFYQTRSTSYRYTQLGTVDDVTGLAEALGSGNVSVTFELN